MDNPPSSKTIPVPLSTDIVFFTKCHLPVILLEGLPEDLLPEFKDFDNGSVGSGVRFVGHIQTALFDARHEALSAAQS